MKEVTVAQARARRTGLHQAIAKAWATGSPMPTNYSVFVRRKATSTMCRWGCFEFDAKHFIVGLSEKGREIFAGDIS